MGGEGIGGPPSSAALGGRSEWEVEYSRFFTFPKPPPISSSSSQSSTAGRPIKVLPRSKTRDGGVWITATSLASLRLHPLFGSTDPSPVLSVSIPGTVYEQHFISKLNITWPQVSCASKGFLGGSRVVLLSFKDCSNQIHKFAARFNTLVEVQSFLKHVKETSSGDMVDLENDLMCGNASPKIASKGNPCRKFVGGRCYKASARESSSSMAQNDSAEVLPLQAPNIDGSCKVLPPSFDDLLNSCLIRCAEEKPKFTKKVCSPPHTKLDLPHSVPNVNTQEKPRPLTDVKVEVVNDSSESSLEDKFARMDGVAEVLGDDL